MTIWQLVLVIGLLLAIAIVLIWLALRPHHPHQATSKDGKAPGSAGTSTNTSLSSSFEEASKEDVQHIFDDEFREELKNRGRLHFEKIIGENAIDLSDQLEYILSDLEANKQAILEDITNGS
jgi:hypothetical protein